MHGVLPVLERAKAHACYLSNITLHCSGCSARETTGHVDNSTAVWLDPCSSPPYIAVWWYLPPVHCSLKAVRAQIVWSQCPIAHRLSFSISSWLVLDQPATFLYIYSHLLDSRYAGQKTPHADLKKSQSLFCAKTSLLFLDTCAPGGVLAVPACNTLSVPIFWLK